MAASKASKPGADPAPSSVTPVESDEPLAFTVGRYSLTEIEPGETHSDIGLDCDVAIPWESQHLSRFGLYFQNREDGRAAVAFALANEIVADLRVAITLQAQAESEHPPV